MALEVILTEYFVVERESIPLKESEYTFCAGYTHIRKITAEVKHGPYNYMPEARSVIVGLQDQKMKSGWKRNRFLGSLEKGDMRTDFSISSQSKVVYSEIQPITR